MFLIRKILYGIVLAAVSGWLVAGLAVADSHEDYANTSEQWEAEYNAGNAAGVAALYTKDAVLMPPNTKAVHGHEAITAFVEKDMSANKGNKLQIESVEYSKNGDLGFARGTFKFMNAAGNVVDQGKWIEVRKKVGGKWYIHSDIWNSDQEPAQSHN